jgi:hypothetical protein
VVFSGYSVSFSNKTDRHDITDIALKMALGTIALTQYNGPDGMGVQKEHVLFMLDKY